MSEEKVTRMFNEVARHLEEMTELFKGPVKVSFIARFPGFPEQDVLIGDDEMDEIIALVERRFAAQVANKPALPETPTQEAKP